ncbi:hypothetical protein [Umezawaea sp. NPDC059074]|uniref:hypothetical protein n=1 Tax=Umezawaea sp. NPDC059074 TaxID=3346716 RepID=UPI00369E9C60
MPVNVWLGTLELGDVFHDENAPFEQRRDEIVKRIKAADWYEPEDDGLSCVLDDLAASPDVEAFDHSWEEFYYWADAARIWVETIKACSC